MAKKSVTRFHTNVRLTHQWDRNGFTVTHHRSQPQRKEGEKRMHPKLKKFDLLKTGTPAEKDLVKYITASMLEKLGEDKTVKIFSALSEVGIKLVDFSNALSSRGPGLSMPKMKWLTDKDGHTKPDFRHLKASTEPTEEYPGESLIDLDMVRDSLAAALSSDAG